METGSLARPASISPANAPQRMDSLATAGAVRTELAPEKAVQHVEAAQAVRFEPTDGAAARAAIDRALRETIDRRISIDPKTREVVFQTVNKETGEVVRQVPDEALMRIRAYAREMRAAHERSLNSDVRRVEKIA
jgi:uncharacterized FlaG/YvyC family protein